MIDIPLSLAVAAYSGTSFSPERRGASAVSEFATTCAEDYESFKVQAIKGRTLDILDAEFTTYRAGLRSRYCAYLSSSSRCVSWIIAGPSKFPAARMNKRADIAHKRLGDYIEWREMARRAVIRNLRPDLRPIMAGDDNATDRLAAKIAHAEKVQERMRAANAAIRKHKKEGEQAQVLALVALNIREDIARELLKPDFCGRIGFADYQLTNNNANIRRMKERLESIERNQAAPVAEREYDNGIRLEDDPPANRIRLFFPGKPDSSVRDKLKSCGFRWSPNAGAWQAYRNNNAMTTAKTIAGATS